jgi:hypothetical protein
MQEEINCLQNFNVLKIHLARSILAAGGSESESRAATTVNDQKNHVRAISLAILSLVD